MKVISKIIILCNGLIMLLLLRRVSSRATTTATSSFAFGRNSGVIRAGASSSTLPCWRTDAERRRSLTTASSVFRVSSSSSRNTAFASNYHKQWKLKPDAVSIRSTHRLFATGADGSDDTGDGFFANENVDFQSMGIKSPILLERIQKELSFTRPTIVQAATFSLLAASSKEEEGDTDNNNNNNNISNNVVIGAETGSGKTLAYLLPLLDDILQRKQQGKDDSTYLGYDYARAIILVPNKELTQQVIRMATGLCGGPQSLVWGAGRRGGENSGVGNDDTIVRLAVMPGGLKENQDFPPFRNSVAFGGNDSGVDIVIATPAALASLAVSPKNIDMFADVQTLVVDEADMLLDGGYIRQLEQVLVGFKRADRLDASHGVPKTQHVFVAATLPDMGLRSVDAYLKRKFKNANRVTMAGMHNARHYGLKQSTIWIEEDMKKERMETLIEMLQTPVEDGGLQNEKVMVFVNSVDDVEGADTALSRAGMNSLPFHAKIGLEERSETLERFRQYDRSKQEENEDALQILVCTNLASRGLDVPDVNAVVQLQFAGNVVAHLHRMGRCGRAGRRTGRGIVFYGSKERELVQVVREAESEQSRMILEGDVDELDEETKEKATVKNAFSRKRGFTKKRKKLIKRATQPSSD